ncbi:Holliday junction resolvase RuvX [Candidatus Microgenomates bacterium]|nr:Holliday junction resolvase RuvX [Candidatus Microgenomates bacterium]
MKYLGIDFGLRRLGLATSEGNLASPFKTIEVIGLKDATDKVSELSQKMSFEKVVIGLPEGKMGETVRGFIKALKKKGFEVESADETLSSKQALDEMIKLNIPKKKRRIRDDIAAAIILQNWLDKLDNK